MDTSRRDFIRTAAAGAAGLAALGTAACSEPMEETAGRAERPLDILVLGGTGFIGPHQVAHARARGHRLTLFNRGRTAPDLFPGVETLIGDRTGDYASVEEEIARGRRWDAVIDNSAQTPSWVALSAPLLAEAADVYLFTSTRSVYSDYSVIGMDASGPVYETEGLSVEGEGRMHYGLRKAFCERLTRQAFGERALIVRPGLIVGPGDPTDRFTYWPARIHRGGEVLAPGDPGDRCMYIDVRDLAEWYIHLLEQGTRGTYNAVGPDGGLTMAELLYGIQASMVTDTEYTWVDAAFLAEHRVRSYTDMPLWVDPVGSRAGFGRFDVSREAAAGLRYRPLAVTARETLTWHLGRPEEERTGLRAGLGPEREAELLALWHARG